jgi:CysZ protein
VRRLGFLDGLKAFFGGIGFIVGRPSTWGWAMIPVVVAGVLFTGSAAGAIWAGSRAAEHFVTNEAGVWTLRILFGIVGVLLAFLVAISLAQPLSGFALDAIARRQELALGGRAWPDQPFFPSLLRSLRVTLTALVVSLPILAILSLVTLLFPPAAVVTIPLKVIVAGCAITYDFIDYPLGLRGEGVRSRASFLTTHFGATLGFGLAASAVLLIPGIGLLLLPFGVAGATRMVVLADRG